MKRLRKIGHYGSSYIAPLLNGHNLSVIVECMAKKIEKSKLVFDYIACRGVSGLMVASPLAIRLNKGIIVIRKGESCHGCQMEASPHPQRKSNYIILDDFFSSGNTLKEIMKGIDKHWNRGNYTRLSIAGVAFYVQTKKDLVEKSYTHNEPKLKRLSDIIGNVPVITGLTPPSFQDKGNEK